MERSDDIFAVILAGGSGTRFWPLSREQWPKQFLKLSGKRSLIAQTVDRARTISPKEEVMIVAGRELAEKIRLELAGEGARFVIEPAARNTAPAIALAARAICRERGDGFMVVLPSDHVIGEADRFLRGVEKALTAAGEGFLVTLGITPWRPETGYGYIRRGEALDEDVFRVERFTEKPDGETALRFLKEGGYYWNSGMFVWKASAFLEEVKRHLPALHEAVANGGDDEESLAESFSGVDPVSVDFGIMEKSGNVAVVACDFSWSDVGSWSALEEIEEKDRGGNVSLGNILALDCHDSIFYGGSDLVAAVGLEGMIVVDTEDATLVVPKKRAQDVRKVVEVLKERGARERVEHRTVHRPWGSYTVLLEGEGFKIKKIEVHPKKRLSLQMHHHRSEHWVVVSGTAKVTRGDEEYLVHANESTFIPKVTKHRLENPGVAPLYIIEVQSGEYVGEDDIVRFSDDFGRGG